ncbi:hypothetical protein G7085_02755 [Tessaracoccus sp. HDW20]|uniref:histidine kinase n=1 Tax=Tessaracoccus coleopterorum TaxID=2714950 RepID=UPI0018D2ABDA|nr:hypothetical protein [Tessaracoccus coleopterorum]
MGQAVLVQNWFTAILVGCSAVLLVIRLAHTRRTGTNVVERQQVLWLGGSGMVSLTLAMGLWMIPSVLTGQVLLPRELIGLPGLAFAFGMGVAMSRHRLFDLDVVLARSMVYAGLVTVSVTVYLLTVATLTSLFAGPSTTAMTVAGAVAVAILVTPARIMLERWVSRALYGDRDDPYAALARLTGLLAARQIAWRDVADDLRSAFRVGYIAVLADGVAPAESGVAPEDAERILTQELRHADARVGDLLIATRGRGGRFSPAERDLLRNVGDQVAAAVHQERLDAELRESRARLVLAREEERRAMRRTLHDDVGPAMAAIPLRVQAVRLLTVTQAPEVAEVLDRIGHDATHAAETVRRLAYDLRPPVLDEVGLLRALEERAATTAPLSVGFDVEPACVASGALSRRWRRPPTGSSPPPSTTPPATRRPTTVSCGSR